MNPRPLFQIAAVSLVAFVMWSCEEYPPYATSGFYPRAAPAGWWHDDGVSGSPKIIVHIGEQKAYFYKGKTLVGWTTVSTGKPGFGTPPGHYTVLSKDADHVSTIFGDYVDSYGGVVRSNIDARKDSRPKARTSMAHGCRTRCSSGAVTRCTRDMFHHLLHRMVAFAYQREWQVSSLNTPPWERRSP